MPNISFWAAVLMYLTPREMLPPTALRIYSARALSAYSRPSAKRSSRLAVMASPTLWALV